MDGKTLAIAALVVTALLLGGIVASGLRQEKAAYAQNGVYSTYLLATARAKETTVNFVVVDTAKCRMLFYTVQYDDEEVGARPGARPAARAPAQVTIKRFWDCDN